MGRMVLIVAALTLLDVGCSFDSPQSMKIGVHRANGEVSAPEVLIAKLEFEFKEISEDKPCASELIEWGRVRVNEKKLRFEDALLLAKLAAALKQVDDSTRFYKVAIALNQNWTITSRFEIGEALLKLGKYDLTVHFYKDMLDNDGLIRPLQASYSNGYLALALANYYQADEALEVIGGVIIAMDGDASLRVFEAWIYVHTKRWDNAIQKFEQVIRDFPDDESIVLKCQLNFCNIYVKKGDILKGEELLTKLWAVNPDNAQINNDLGYIWADQGKNLEQAEKMIRKSLTVEPHNTNYLDSFGWILFKRGKYEEAISVLDRATQDCVGDDAIVWNHLGDAFMASQKLEKAVEAWQSAVRYLEEDSSPDPQLIDGIKQKLNQHPVNANTTTPER